VICFKVFYVNKYLKAYNSASNWPTFPMKIVHLLNRNIQSSKICWTVLSKRCVLLWVLLVTYDVGGHVVRYRNRWGSISTLSLFLIRNLRHTCCKILCWRHYCTPFTPFLFLSFVFYSLVSVFLDFYVYERLTFFEYEGTFAWRQWNPKLARPSARMKPFGKDGTDYHAFYIVKFDRNLLNTFKFE